MAARFETSIDLGLLDSQVKLHTTRYGLNNFGKEQTISYLAILAHQVFNAMVLVLIISMVIALAIKDWISGGVIGFVVFINIFVGFIQEVKAEKTMSSLRSLSTPTARVLRNGLETNIDASHLVPGDVVLVSVGDTVPADLRLFSSINLECDEALLTGESLPVSKDYLQQVALDCSVGDRCNMAYSSTVVAKGRGLGIAVSTGLDTEIGKIASELRNSADAIIVKVDRNSPNHTFFDYFKASCRTVYNIIMNVLGTNVGTPLQRRLSWLAIILFWVAVLFAIVVMASQKFTVTKNVAIYAICVALSMIPSSLIVVLTITMAIGAQVMVTKNVVVRKLDSLEALGGINDICSDKTGTLTMGKMIAKRVWIPSLGTFAVEGSLEPFNPDAGQVLFSELQPCDGPEFGEKMPAPVPPLFQKWINTATLANIATVTKLSANSGSDAWDVNGDATEIAINVFTTRLGFSRDKMVATQRLEHVAEFPFDSSVKLMSSVYTVAGDDVSAVAHTKGAVERLVPLCSHWLVNDKLTPMTSDAKHAIEANMDALSALGLRVLGFAQKSFANSASLNRSTVESDLVFLGLIGIYDPPRLETAELVRLCHAAGINVRMLTGDHPGTARAIAQEVGILPANMATFSRELADIMVMTAHDFDALLDDQIDALPVLPLVIARCAPHTKVRMIEALHRRDRYVAMTGDGVNDSPSLKKADVGIAMGLNGSDVAKDASDIVLSDDNFASILNAIEEGRRMLANIQKFVLQLLAENVAQALYLVVGLAFMDEDHFSVFPLSPVETLWIIVVTSCFPAMGLGQERASDDLLKRRPNSQIFTRKVLLDMMFYGVWMASCCMAVFVLVVYALGNGDLGKDCNATASAGCDLVFRGRLAAFSSFTWCALLLAWECMHFENSFFNMNPNLPGKWLTKLRCHLWENQFLFWSVFLAFFTVFPVIYIPVINKVVFLHGPLGEEWGLAIGFTLVFFAGCEIYKWVCRVVNRRSSARNDDMESRDPFKMYASHGSSRDSVKDSSNFESVTASEK